MTNPESESAQTPEYPFFDSKIPVASGLEGFTSFIETYPSFTFCPYVAEKDAESWDKSTSRVYMNQVLPNFLYVPVNIPKGGVGEPIAKKVAAEKPSSLLLVDLADKTAFAPQLSETSHVAIAFEHNLHEMIASGLPENAVVINAASKEGATNESELAELIQRGTDSGVFIDIRPHLDVTIVEEAKRRGWDAHTGHGMNARNDYVLLQGIAHQVPGATPPSFEEFQRLVARAS